MNELDNESFWKSVDSDLKKLLDRCRTKLDSDAIRGVEHYLDHDEYEMAYEGLFIELMRLDYWPGEMDLGHYMEIGRSLHLYEESVFMSEFWSGMIKYSRLG